MRNAECKVQSAEWEGRGPGRKQKSERLAPEHLTPRSPQSGEGIGAGDWPILVTRRGLAEALGVSLRTVERMLHDEEIEPVRLRRSVRFHVAEVVRQLVESGATRKNGRKADVGRSVERQSVEREAAETRYPRRAE